MTDSQDEIEILSTDLLETLKKDIKFIDYIMNLFALIIGWHYILDIAWIASKIDLPRGSTILDAGAARGLLQFVLACKGYNVVSVDFSERNPPPHITPIIPFETMDDDEIGEHEYLDRLQSVYGKSGDARKNRGKRIEMSFANKLSQGMSYMKRCGLMGTANYLKELVLAGFGFRKHGTITYYRADFTNMKQLDPESIDCVVSVSALEHNDHEAFRKTIKEFTRVLKKGSKMIITTSAARDEDEWHEPSMGWCYCESSLVELFGLSKGFSSNFDDFDLCFEKLKKSKGLESRLAPFYFESGDNGMPWGVWKPDYQPVGVIKYKRD